MKATAKWLKLKRINQGGGNSDSERQISYVFLNLQSLAVKLLISRLDYEYITTEVRDGVRE